MRQLLIAVTAAMGGLFGGVILLFVLGANLDKTRMYKKVALTTTQDRTKGYVSTATSGEMIGLHGVAHTVLRPSGKVEINGKIYDAYTRGDFIEKGQAVEVIGDEGPALKVKVQA